MSDPSRSDPLLSLDTLIVRPTVEIDGTAYEIRSPDELSVLESRRFELWAKKIEAQETSEEPTAELDELADTITRQVLIGVPDDVMAKLTGQHKIAVVAVFTGLLLRGRAGVVRAITKAMGSPPTGVTSFPGSSASTAERRASGWRTRLWRWFKLTLG